MIGEFESTREANDELIEPRQCAINSSTNPKIQSKGESRLSHAERVLAKRRLDEEGFRESIPTPKDGNCFPHAIMDQIRYACLF